MIKSYTVNEFVKEFRPDGKGHIKFEDGTDIAFDEIVCDLCNAELTQPKDKPNEKVVFVLDSYGMCKECADSCKECKEVAVKQ